jgi:carboxypeptidase Taq
MDKKLKELRIRLTEAAKLNSALALLNWDEEVNLGPKGHAFRGQANAALAAELHKRMTDPKFVILIAGLARKPGYNRLSADGQVVVRESWRDVSRLQKLPVDFVREMAALSSKAFGVWAQARQKSDFDHYLPVLSKIIQLKRREAELVGYKGHPYDALLDEFEPDLTCEQLDKLFLPLAGELTKLVAAVKDSPPLALPKSTYPLPAQTALNREIAASLGYDLQAGRIDASPHPFMVTIHPGDNRITTRYDEQDFWVSTGAAIHEVGHALYEQGLPARHFGTPLGEAVSLGIHESQSRTWENFVGRSPEFSEYLHTLLVKYFDKKTIRYTPGKLHKWLNRIQPSFIRVEADEVTYNLHIILRYEIEKLLIEGSLQPKELPGFWNQKVKQYLGLTVKDDAQGVLQDVHWAHGAIGYFPTYSLGNLYAAQLYNAALLSMPRLPAGYAHGRFKPLLGWLRTNIHQTGRRYRPAELVEKVTGQPPDSSHLLEHLKAKVNLQTG